MYIPDLVKNDEYLKPYINKLAEIYESVEKKRRLLCEKAKTLKDVSNGHLYYGIHNYNDNKYIIREWAPNANEIWLIGDLNNWTKNTNHKFVNIGKGNWELEICKKSFKHLSLYKLIIVWDGGEAERLPAWTKRVVQDDNTKIFSAQVWMPTKPYVFKNPIPPMPEIPLIYEAHVGMSLEEGKVASFKEFSENVLPRIASMNYNIIQLMAIQEHPYYGSFGYHVSNFFAVSSRFGTPDDLKELIDHAHGLGIRVIMDIVHSHAVKNEAEGLSCYDGSPYQFFHDGHRGNHIAWDSRCFDYGKLEVLHFLLSNCKFWLEEYLFDGFRFDGVTSMIYINHGLNQDFLSYDDYFNNNLDVDALAYLSLANQLIHEIRPDATTVAEDMSGFPGMASTVEYGGLGFNYRLAMGIPDYWIRIIKEYKDEDWHVGDIFHNLTNKRADEKIISYAESHDQALVGDKTIIFRLIDADMYFHMDINNRNLNIDRGIALHKIIRLITISTAGGAYLNFMGNEFGHPEWIDFPRIGNNWSYHYARRQWSLAENTNLRYIFLNNFDKAITSLVINEKLFNYETQPLVRDNEKQILVYKRGESIFIFNFSPNNSYTDYSIPADIGKWKIILNTDNKEFDGFERIDESIYYEAQKHENYTRFLIYIPARTALVLKKQ